MSKKLIVDEPSEVREIDKFNMLSFCVDAARHYRNGAKLADAANINYPKPETIVVAGMGGSAIGGDLLKDWAMDKVDVPIEVCRDYHLPAYVKRRTLVIAISYSGETEETLSAFLEALKRKSMIVTISSGGTLQEFAELFSIPHLMAPSGMAPRATLPYLFMPLPVILEKVGCGPRVSDEFSATVTILKKVAAENSPEIQLSDNPAKMLASQIRGTIPTIYGFGFYRAVAQRFKTQINENSKNLSKWDVFPELNHNEIVGWEKASEFAELLSVVFVRDKAEPEEIRQRIKVTKELIGHTRARLLDVWSQGKERLAKMSSVICLGDFTSVYLAVLRGVDPTPVESIDLLKGSLKETRLKERIVHKLRRLAKE